jgi:hypothetical protein
MPILQKKTQTDTETITSSPLKLGDDVICEKFPQENGLYIANIRGDFALCLALSPSRFIEEILLSELQLKGEVGHDETH